MRYFRIARNKKVTFEIFLSGSSNKYGTLEFA